MDKLYLILGFILTALLSFILGVLYDSNKERKAKNRQKQENKKKLEQIEIHAPNLLKILADLLKDNPALYGFWFQCAGGSFEFKSFDRQKSLYKKIDIDRTDPINPITMQNEIDIFIDEKFLKFKHAGQGTRKCSFNNDVKKLIQKSRNK